MGNAAEFRTSALSSISHTLDQNDACRHFVELGVPISPICRLKRLPRQPPISDQVGTIAAQVGASGSQLGTRGPQIGTTEIQVGAIWHPETNNFNRFNTCVFSKQLFER